MNFLKDLFRHRAEFRKALDGHKYERMGDGRILFPDAKVIVGGHFGVSVNDGPVEWSHNLVVNEGLDDLLKTYLGAGSQITSWYIAPFSGNVTPVNTWTAANFTTNATELTAYAESTRPAWTPDAEASQNISNSTTKASLTANASNTAYGAALISASAKSATSGKLFAASRFSTPRALTNGDVLNIQYSVGATSA